MDDESRHEQETKGGGGPHERVSPDRPPQFEGEHFSALSSAGSALAKSLGVIFTQRLAILREPIDEISEQITCRETLSRALTQEIDQTRSHLDFLLRDLDTWSLGHNDNIERRRIALMEAILTLEKERRGEKLRLWEDVVSLMHKRRDFLTEYKSFERFRALL